jgi:NAD(P)-dependent dehydrogenase (short-subunit alcohol dehydrogenase family)
MRFQNRVALVTGGASGIGLTTATELAREGASVAVADLQAGPVESAARQVAEAGRPV